MKRVVLILLSVYCFAQSAVAETDTFAAAGTGGKILALPAGARPAGLGNAFTGAAGDVNALYSNPAGLIGLTDRRLMLAHNSWIEGINQEYLVYAQPVEGLGAVGLGIDYLNYGPIDRWAMDESGNPSAVGGAYTPYALAGSLGWALPVGKGFSAGVVLKWSYEQIDTSGSVAGAVDLGGIYRVNSDLTWGAAVHNLGLAAGDHLLPLTFNLGSSFDLPVSISEQDLFTAYLDLALKYDDSPTLGLGLEYSFLPWFQLRAGWNQNFGHVSPTLFGFTAGAGAAYQQWGLDYALAPQGDFGLSHKVSVQYGF
jgi:hypothetical protein